MDEEGKTALTENLCQSSFENSTTLGFYESAM